MTTSPFSLQGQRIVIVGGSSGIGFAVGELAQELGGQITLASSTAAKVEAAVARLPGAHGAVVDLRQEGSIVAFLAGLEAFDHLVLTGGDYDPRVFAPTEDLDLPLVREAFEARVLGSIAFIRHGRGKIKPGGSITLTSGVLAHRPRKGSPLPTLVAGAVEQVVRGFAIDLAPLRINGVCPGLTATDFIMARGAQRVAALTANQPVPRAATPREVAQAYIHLIANGFITGQIVPVDGGGLLV